MMKVRERIFTDCEAKEMGRRGKRACIFSFSFFSVSNPVFPSLLFFFFVFFSHFVSAADFGIFILTSYYLLWRFSNLNVRNR